MCLYGVQASRMTTASKMMAAGKAIAAKHKRAKKYSMAPKNDRIDERTVSLFIHGQLN